ncbi:sensor histidine kinase, partial [Blastomonas fulva]|uniref:sensor histidine kinase n=1 Tax=Blastomonas fulva TaxID=1550728 RepID=UPI003F7207C1
SVCDDGPGQTSDEADFVTERFFRGAAGRNAGGDGLGLSLVAAIADWHRCDLEFVNSAPGLVVTLRWT